MQFVLRGNVGALLGEFPQRQRALADVRVRIYLNLVLVGRLQSFSTKAMFTRFLIVLVAFVVGFAILGADTPTAIKKVPLSRTSPSSGKDMFATYCAACHGTDGKGGGPAVAALKVPPPDLTTMSKRNGGKFPQLRVYNTINGDVNVPAHGSKDMPIWGDLFRSIEKDSATQQMRVSNLTKFIDSLQTK